MRKDFNKLSKFLFLGKYKLEQYFGDDYLLTTDLNEAYKILKERYEYCYNKKFMCLDDFKAEKVIVLFNDLTQVDYEMFDFVARMCGPFNVKLVVMVESLDKLPSIDEYKFREEALQFFDIVYKRKKFNEYYNSIKMYLNTKKIA